MNENHFAKLAKKSPYYFYLTQEKTGGGWVRNENGVPWVDEFGKTHWINVNRHYQIRTHVGYDKRQHTKLENNRNGYIYFIFTLAEDSKIKMRIYSYSDDIWAQIQGPLGIDKYISYGEFKKICKNGITVSKKQLKEWVAEQIKKNKEAIAEDKLNKINEDF